MRGQLIDWDLAMVKNEMKKKPAPLNVTNRQDFIDAKLRRRVKKVRDDLSKVEAAKVEREIASPPVEEQPLIDEAVDKTNADAPETAVVDEDTTATTHRTVRRKSQTSKPK
jgi:hypothetical protein